MTAVAHRSIDWEAEYVALRDVVAPFTNAAGEAVLDLARAHRSAWLAAEERRQARRSPDRVRARLKAVWRAMLARCSSPRSQYYAAYGGRGISVCARWRDSFGAFATDMGPAPQGLTLERKDNDGNYEPSNCRWASARDQANNRRSTKTLRFGGRSASLADMARHYGLSEAVVHQRLDAGWSVGDALTTALIPRERRKHGPAMRGANGMRQMRIEGIAEAGR